jgi:hypothetical protein
VKGGARWLAAGAYSAHVAVPTWAAVLVAVAAPNRPAGIMALAERPGFPVAPWRR